MVKFLGFKIERDASDEEEDLRLQSITPEKNDGSLVVDTTTSAPEGVDAWGYSMSFDIDASIASEQQLIQKYREIAMIPEVEMAVDDIINEIISLDIFPVISLNLDELSYQKGLKDKINDEFEYILNLLNFNTQAFKILKGWYIDGRLHYQVVVDPKTYKEVGIAKLVQIDSQLIKKVRVVKRQKDIRTGADLYADIDEYFLFSETGFGARTNAPLYNQVEQGIKLSKDSVVQVTSDLLTVDNNIVLSYLHKAIRPLNQLRALEDASVIYRLVRAPERRAIYFDVGNLPPAKAEQLVKRQAQQFRTKMVYDTSSGTVRADPKQMLMTEDFFLPRRGDNKATEIQTIQGGQNLGEMTEVDYFLNKVYRALNVPISRMDPQAGFNFGRVTEINRDEVKFMKFIVRLRHQFSTLFFELLKRQLALKNILHPDEFERVKNQIVFEYKSDNIFDEAKTIEIMNSRMDLVQKMDPFVGKYFSQQQIRRDFLHQTQEEIDQTDGEMAEEEADGKYEENEPDEMGGGMGAPMPGGGMPAQLMITPSPQMADPNSNLKKPATKPKTG